MIIYNGSEINTEDELEAAISSLDDYNKNIIRSQFYGTAPPSTTNVPLVISPRQMRQQLLIKGHTEDAVVAQINTLSSPLKEMTLIAWEYTTAFNRYGPLIPALQAAFGWTNDDLDAFWIAANNL